MSRLRLFIILICLAWGSLLSAQSRAGFQASENAALQCALAGVPAAKAATGDRVFFTIQEDFWQNGTLAVAAGARAKGTIVSITRTADSLQLAVLPMDVQSISGAQWPIQPVIIRISVNLNDPKSGRLPFNVGLAMPEQAVFTSLNPGR
jgi:hypothetical protein